MASEQRNVDFVLEQMSGAGNVWARKMFGEYAIYCGDKLVALFCDDQLFLKPTDAGRAFLERQTVRWSNEGHESATSSVAAWGEARPNSLRPRGAARAAPTRKDVKEAPPYPGAKPYFLITGDRCEDGEWLSELVRTSERALPKPKPKLPRKTAKTKKKSKLKVPRAKPAPSAKRAAKKRSRSS